MLRDGGNAVDAALSAAAVLCVVYPHMTSIGGDLFALVWPPGASAPLGYAGAGLSGETATIAAVRDLGHESMPQRGALSITVPGAVDAWGRLLERFGSVGLGAILDPAVAMARDGYEVTPQLAAALVAADWMRRGDPDAARIFPPLKAGMRLRNPDLATTLAAIARRGFNGFYRGETGHAIGDAVADRGGLLTAMDMFRHRGALADHVVGRYRGLTVFQAAPPSQGLASLGMMARLERLAGGDLRPGPAMAQAVRHARDRVYPLRDSLICDPDFSAVPEAPFLEPDGDEKTGAATAAPPEGDTVYLCAADEHGTLVSLIQSVSGVFGSGVIPAGTGVLLHNRGAYFRLEETHVNRLEPRKRTMHTLTPGMVGRRGAPWAAYGSRGADGQPVIQAQVLCNLVDCGMSPDQAVAAPRVRPDPGGATLAVEADYPGAGALSRAGGIRLLPPHDPYTGHAMAAVADGRGGWSGGADPRSEGGVEIVA